MNGRGTFRNESTSGRGALIYLCIATITLCALQTGPVLMQGRTTTSVTGTVMPSHPFNATAFWDTEKARVEGTSLDVSFIQQNTTVYQGMTFNRTDLAYDTPNWVGASPATLRVYGTLFTPTNASGTLPLSPGIVVVHGTGQKRHSFFDEGLSYAAMDCAVLVIDLVGHGASDGPKPVPEYTIYQGDFNKTSYHYLAICNGMQAVNLMRSLTSLVDPTRIAITGLSLGGMVSEIVGAIYHEHVALVLPSGMINVTSTFPETAVRNLANMTYEELLAVSPSIWQYINPVNYIRMAQYPDVCPFVGTTDEYFSHKGIPDVWQALQASSNGKWLQIMPNGHHSYPSDQTPHFLIRHRLFGGPPPPTITVTKATNMGGVMESFGVEVTVTSSIEIRSVELCYRYLDIVGEPWRTVTMSAAGSDQWAGRVDSPWLTSETDCFVKVTLEANEPVFFTSNLLEAGVLMNYLSFMSILGIIAVIAIPVLLAIKGRYKVEVMGFDEKHLVLTKKHFIVENILVASSESTKFAAMSMPWMMYGTVPWSLFYIMQAYFTYDAALGDVASCFNSVLFVAFFAISVTSTFNPLLAGIFNMAWAIVFYLVADMMYKAFSGDMTPDQLGSGFYIFLVIAVAQIAIWTWKRYYHKRLGIPTRSLITIIKGHLKPRSSKV